MLTLRRVGYAAENGGARGTLGAKVASASRKPLACLARRVRKSTRVGARFSGEGGEEIAQVRRRRRLPEERRQPEDLLYTAERRRV